MRITRLSLLAVCLTLATIPAIADVYNNGPINGTVDAWTINSGFVVSDTFFVAPENGLVDGIVFGAWTLPGDTLISAEVSITSQEFGGTSYFDQVVNFTQSNCASNPLGFVVCNETGSFNVNLASGSYWLNLQNATVTNGDPIYWDENSGPSLASQNSLGTIPSEAFTVLAVQRQFQQQQGTPEPASILLFGSGVLGLAGVLRRKLF